VSGRLTIPPGWARGLAGNRYVRATAGWVGGVVLFYLALHLLWPIPAGVVGQGLILGSLYALLALGIALIYRSNRVINFAQADLGVVPAVLAVTLMTRTRVNPSTYQQVNDGWPFWAAVPMAIVLAVLLGAAVEKFLIRRFNKSPRLILMVVTIGLAQVLEGLATTIQSVFGTQTIAGSTATYNPPFSFHFEIAPVIFGGNDLFAVVMVGVVIVGLVWFLRFTNLGIAVRASAESADRAGLLGVNVGLTQNVVWIVATVLSTLAALLQAGILGLTPGVSLGPQLMVRALAAAVIGRMERFGVIFAASCGIGVVETAIIWNKGSSTLVDPVLFVIIIVTLLLQRRRRESRVEDQAVSSWQEGDLVRPVPRELAHLPEVRWGFRGLRWAFILGLLLLPLVLSAAQANLFGAIFIYAMVAISLVLLTGWGGEISLGQVGLVAIGAAASASLNAHFHLDLTVTALAAGLVGALAAVIIGLPALRIRGLMLAVTTLAFATATSSYLLNRTYFPFLPDNETTLVRRFPLLGHLDLSSEKTFYYVCLVTLGLVALSARGLRRSRIYRVLLATRDNPRAAQAMGISLTRVKLTAFALSGFFAAFAGGLLAIQQRALGQQIFDPIESIRALTIVVVGGLVSVPGALLGAGFVKGLEYFNTALPANLRALFTVSASGVGLIVVLNNFPNGLGSLLYRVRDEILRAIARWRGIVVPSLVADVAPVSSAKKHRPVTGFTSTIAPMERPPGLLRFVHRRRAPALGYMSFPDLKAGGAASSLLSIRSMDVSYGQVQVLFGVNLEVPPGHTVALLGTNGAGKSTVLRAVSGLVAPKGGSVSFDGTQLNGMAPHAIAAMGVVQVPGGRGVFPSLTVAENLKVASWLYRRQPGVARQATKEVLEIFPILRERLEMPAASLSGGQQQMLTLGMAFIARPRLLMIDELSLGLAPVLVEQLLGMVRRFREEGTTVILVEQSVNVALTVADTAYFMEKGEVVFRGPTAELLDRPDVLRSVFLEGAGTAGRRPAEVRVRDREVAPPAGSNGQGPVVLETRSVSKHFAGVTAVEGVSIALKESEILGIIGPNGAGKTTLFDLISGFLVPDAGSIEFGGRDITAASPEMRSRRGLARSFQDPRLFGSLTVHETIAVALDRELEVKDPLAAALNLPDVARAEQRLGQRVDELIDLMGLSAFRDKFVSELSTGSRRIVDLACQVGMKPRVILFDEPSSGIAQRETEALAPLLLGLRERTGAALLVIEHDMPLITAVSDRLVALDLGRVVAEGSADDVLNDAHVVASYLGTDRASIARSGTGDGELIAPDRSPVAQTNRQETLMP
jgi:ABC-type branched-subunit amino acid transport system ATPase component/ABC-type branched-subunit amino acid transport system permease subunit